MEKSRTSAVSMKTRINGQDAAVDRTHVRIIVFATQEIRQLMVYTRWNIGVLLLARDLLWEPFDRY
jgi:hypothetical protein